MTNRQVTLSSRPQGYPTLSDFSVLESQVPEPAEGEVLVKALWLSLDPYMRGRMNDAQSYAPSVQIGEVIVGGVVGRIERSRTPAFSEGEIVTGPLGWREYALSDGRNLSRVDTSLGPISTALGVLGMPGMTAYFGFLDVAAPTGTLVRAPADGVITLTHPDMYFSGGTIILDHGQGLSSTFLHLSEILVEAGITVKKGDAIGRIGSTGRASGAHLDWRMNWLDRRVDPQRLVTAKP